MHIIGYTHSATYKNDKITKQIQLLREYGCQNIFWDEGADRSQREKAISALSEKSTLVISSLSKLSRNSHEMSFLMEKVKNKKAKLKVLDLDVEISDDYSNMFLNEMINFAKRFKR